MVPSGNRDYIIIIILWGIKDLSQPVSVALQNTRKSQHSVTKSIVQIFKKKKDIKSWKGKVHICWTRAMCCFNDSMSKNWRFEKPEC